MKKTKVEVVLAAAVVEGNAQGLAPGVEGHAAEKRKDLSQRKKKGNENQEGNDEANQKNKMICIKKRCETIVLSSLWNKVERLFVGIAV